MCQAVLFRCSPLSCAIIHYKSARAALLFILSLSKVFMLFELALYCAFHSDCFLTFPHYQPSYLVVHLRAFDLFIVSLLLLCFICLPLPLLFILRLIHFLVCISCSLGAAFAFSIKYLLYSVVKQSIRFPQSLASVQSCALLFKCLLVVFV